MTQKVLLLLIFLSSIIAKLDAQPSFEEPTAIQYYDVAKNHLKQANYDNAIAALINAIQLSPENLMYKQELGRVFLISNQLKKAEIIFASLLKDELADEATYKYATEVQVALDNVDNAKQIIDKGLRKLPTSGLLYYTKGNVYDYYKEFNQALDAYEKGIEVEPEFPLNYYHAAKLQLKNPNNFVACIVYAETYIALDPFSNKTEDMKSTLYNGYNRLCALLREDKDIAPQNNAIFSNKGKAFEKKILDILESNKKIILSNNNATNLSLLRTKFIVEWHRKQPNPFPETIYNRLQQYIIEGFFPVYNMWLFGGFGRQNVYEDWLASNQGRIKDMNLYFYEHPYTPINTNKKNSKK